MVSTAMRLAWYARRLPRELRLVIVRKRDYGRMIMLFQSFLFDVRIRRNEDVGRFRHFKGRQKGRPLCHLSAYVHISFGNHHAI